MKNERRMVKLLMATVAAVALLGPAVAYSAAAGSSCSCPCGASTSAQSSLQPGLADSAFYRPFIAMQQEMDRLSQDMNNVMQEAFFAPGTAGVGHEQLYSRINMETTPKEYRITMTAPDLGEKDIKIDVSQDNTLTIHSEKNLVQKTGAGTQHSFGSFSQMLTLPPDADAAHVQTSFKNGEYTVTLPRKGTTAGQPSNKPEGPEKSL